MSELFGDPASMGADDFVLPGDENFTQPPADTPVAVEEQPAEGQPRDEHGKFAAATEETPAPADPEEQTPEEAAEVSALQRLMAAKGWTDAEQIAQGYLNLEQHTGGLRDELGQLRRTVEERLAPQEQPQEQTAAQMQYDPYQLAEWAATVPPTQLPAAAEQALKTGNDQVLDAVIEQWKEVDGPGARQFERWTTTVRAAALLRVQGAQEQQATQGVAQTAEQFVAAHPDFEPLAPTMRDLAQQPENRYIGHLLNSPDPEARLDGVTRLYTMARDRTQSANLDARSREIAHEHAVQAEQAIKDAAVVSTTAPAAAPVLNDAQRIGAEWDKLEAPIRDGWNI